VRTLLLAVDVLVRLTAVGMSVSRCIVPRMEEQQTATEVFRRGDAKWGEQLAALGLAALAFGATFLLPVYNSVQMLSAHISQDSSASVLQPQPVQEQLDIAKLEALLLAFGLVILALARWCGPFLGRGFGLRDWDRHVAVRAWVVVPAAILTSLLVPAFVAQVVASGSGFHRPDEHSTLGLIVWTSVHAGVSEELLVLMLPLCVMELFRVRHWWVVYVVAVALRVSYHIDYGWGVLALLPWAIATVWLFRRYRAGPAAHRGARLLRFLATPSAGGGHLRRCTVGHHGCGPDGARRPGGCAARADINRSKAALAAADRDGRQPVEVSSG
jgi:hypothetical protein